MHAGSTDKVVHAGFRALGPCDEASLSLQGDASGTYSPKEVLRVSRAQMLPCAPCSNQVAVLQVSW